MSGASGTYGGEEKYLKEFQWGNMHVRGHLKDLGTDGRIILK